MNWNSFLLLTINITLAADIPSYFSSPFIMPSQDTSWKLAHSLYITYLQQKPIRAECPRIPRIIHQIWLGSEVPEKYHCLQESFKQFHPDWEYCLWTDEMINTLQLINKDVYDSSTNYGEKSDIARYEILYRFGGVYADMDVKCLASFDEFHHYVDFYAGISPLHAEVVAENCIVGSCPGNPILALCIERLTKKEGDSSYFMKIIDGTGPQHLTRCFFLALNQAFQLGSLPFINVLLPEQYFFSRDVFKHVPITHWPILAIHYWEGTWQLPEHRWHSKAWHNYAERWMPA
jgi:mannosyltransferase OCH1-like enzyme